MLVNQRCGIVDTIAYYTMQSERAEQDKAIKRLRNSLRDCVYVLVIDIYEKYICKVFIYYDIIYTCRYV